MTPANTGHSALQPPNKASKAWRLLTYTVFICMPPAWLCLFLYEAEIVGGPFAKLGAILFVVLMLTGLFLPPFAPKHVRYVASDNLSQIRAYQRGNWGWSVLLNSKLTNLGADEDLDEWERAARLQALTIGYRLDTIFFGVLVIASVSLHPYFTMISQLFLVLMLYVCHQLVPAAYLATTVKPLADDE